MDSSTTADRDTLGYVNPDWVGGFRNTLTYKGFYLTVFFDFRKGGDIYSVTKSVGQKAGILQSTVDGGIRENGMIVDGVYEEGAIGIVVFARNKIQDDWIKAIWQMSI